MNHLGRECSFEALGKTWTAGRMTRRVLIDFADWARPLVPNPIQEALKNIDQATAADAAVLRDLTAKDLAEEVKAKAEGREPILLRPLYTPISSKLVSDAQERAACYLEINSPEIQSILRSFKGQAYLFFLQLRKHHPDIDLATVDDILDELSADEITRITRVTSGKEKEAKNAPAPAE